MLLPTALAPKKSAQIGSKLIHQTSFASIHNNSLLSCSIYKIKKDMFINKNIYKKNIPTIALIEVVFNSEGKVLMLSVAEI